MKSTIPVGFIDDVRERLKTDVVIFSPEFLREGKALYDNLHPSRIIVGEKSVRAKTFAKLLSEAAIRTDIDFLFTGTREAEAIKLFSNAYLAMRVAFFNELDSYALAKDMSSREVIDGISLDPRIGRHYNNPSFGYGGYCLPKDTKQLLADYGAVPQKIVRAIVDANSTRQDFLADLIIKEAPRFVGIYRLLSKTGSDNFRHSSVIKMIQRLQAAGIDIIIYEPCLTKTLFPNVTVLTNLDEFKRLSDIIIANRMHCDLNSHKIKVFTRDLYGVD